MPVAGHIERPLAQPQALVEAQVRSGDLQADAEVAPGTRVPADVGPTFSR